MPAIIQKVGYDFSNLEVTISLVQMQGLNLRTLATLPIADGIEEITYTGSFEREKMYGTNRQPQARTEGIADYEATLTMLNYWWRYIIDVCTVDLRIGLAEVEMNILVQYVKNGIPLKQDLIYRAAIKSPESSFKRGTENLMISVDLDPMNIYYNGVDSFNKTLM